MQNRRERYSQSDLEHLPIENIGRLRRGSSLKLSSFLDDQLLEAIEKIEKEKKHLQLENILYSRYLRRVESAKIQETFDDYEDQSDVILTERRASTNQTTVRVTLPEIARRSSVKKSSGHSSKTSPLWSKLVRNWREYIYTPLLLRVEQEKLSIAAYEIEQTKLDWDRMKANSRKTLDQFDDLLQAAESDEIIQKILISDFRKNFNQLRDNIKEDKLLNPHFLLPTELFIHLINKQIQSRISSIGLLRVDTTRTQFRIRTIDTTIHNLDDQRDQMDEIDLNFVRTRIIDYRDTYEKLDRKCILQRSSQYPFINELRKWKQILAEQEQEKLDYEYKSHFLQNSCDKLQQEIQTIEVENQSIAKENRLIKTRITDVEKVPTITDYAHIMKETKRLQHEIYIWTQRVNIAETLLVQLTRQTKSPNVLPSIIRITE